MQSWKAIFFVIILLSSISVIPLTFAQIAPVAIFQSPKKQAEQVPIYRVKCNDDLVLMKKLSDGSPACVREQTAQKLVERGWGIRFNPNTFPYNTLENSNAGTMNVTNTKFSVNYTITNAKIVDIKGDIPSGSLVVSIKSDSNGVLAITIPRALLDPKLPNGKDDKFFVLNDGQETDFNEIKTTDIDRTVTIPFSKGTTEIEFVVTMPLSGH